MASPGSENGFFYVIQEKLDILFVDDDPILREFASVHLSGDQVSVATAEDGLDAIEKVSAHRPDIILCDLEMPNMDGFQFLKHLSEDDNLKGMPVIVVTGREDVLAIDRAYQAGATSFVVKPLNWRQLAYQIRYVHRTHAHERAVSAERDAARRRLKAVAMESSDFLSGALSRYPDLKPSAARYAQQLTEAMRS